MKKIIIISFCIVAAFCSLFAQNDWAFVNTTMPHSCANHVCSHTHEYSIPIAPKLTWSTQAASNCLDAIQINKQRAINEAHQQEFVLTREANNNPIQYANNNYELPIAQRQLDNEDITPDNWKWLDVEVVDGAGNKTNAILRRPDWWIIERKADAMGNHFHLAMPEMNLFGDATVKNIWQSEIDTRYMPELNESQYRPIIGWFEREATVVWNITLSNGEQIGTTPNHRFYSEDRKGYFAISDFEIGECLQLSDGSSVALAKKERAKAQKVYNLDVWRGESFLVGESELVAGKICQGSGLQNHIDNLDGQGVISTMKYHYDNLLNKVGFISIAKLRSSDNKLLKTFTEILKDTKQSGSNYALARMQITDDLTTGKTYLISTSGEELHPSIIAELQKNHKNQGVVFKEAPIASTTETTYKSLPCKFNGEIGPLCTNHTERKFFLEYKKGLESYAKSKNINANQIDFSVELISRFNPCPSCAKVMTEFLQEFPKGKITMYAGF